MAANIEGVELGLDELEGDIGWEEKNSSDSEVGLIDSHIMESSPLIEAKSGDVSSFPDLHPELDKEKIIYEFKSALAVGKKAECFETVYSMYCEYGRCLGFGVRRHNQKFIGTSRVVKWKEFTCSCAGFPDTKAGRLHVAGYRKRLLRTGCKAKVRVNKENNGSFSITRFDDEHNHEMVPRDQTYLLRSSRKMCPVKQNVIESLDAFGFGVNVSCGYLEKQCGGSSNLGFTRQDAYDHLKLVKRSSKLENADANNLIQHLTDKAYMEPYFFWKVQLDDDGRIMNLFLRDTRCAHDFKSFGDVLSIDTTYRTNKYNLICCPFVGVNHHSMNIMFGIGFLSDETTSSFEWLFRMFLESMSSVQPKLIFTDQCVAMMNAIDKVFPTSKHRLCQWHINKNAPSHFGALNSDDEFKKFWYKCMNDVETVEEFDEVWNHMMVRYNLRKNSWFVNMYRIRSRWASVYSKGIFSAGLHATSRSEATNRVLKALKKKKSSLYEFVQNYEEVVARWRTKEVEEDTLGIRDPGQLVDDNPLLAQAASAYTRNVYKSFEYEFIRSFCVVLVDDRRHVGDGVIEFLATTPQGARPRIVLYNANNDYVSCSCGMLDTDGVHCRHVLKVYSVMNVFAIPDSQIFRRWSKKANHGSDVSKSDVDPRASEPYMNFVNDVIRHVYDVAAISMDNARARKLIRQRIESLRDEVLATIGKPDEGNEKRKYGCELGSNPHWNLYLDPKPIKEKGWILARQKSHWDGVKKKGAVAPKKARVTIDAAVPSCSQPGDVMMEM